MSSKTQHYLDAIDPFASRFIRGKVRQLIGQRGFAANDREDLLQDFAVDLIHRKTQFDPNAATWEAFVIVVCENRFAALIQHRLRSMRDPKRLDGSLNQLVEDDGRVVSFGDTIPESQRTARSGDDPAQADVEHSDCRLDVTEVVTSLPPDLREVSEQLMVESITETAKARGVQRPSMYYSIKALRKHFAAAGLQIYV